VEKKPSPRGAKEEFSRTRFKLLTALPSAFPLTRWVVISAAFTHPFELRFPITAAVELRSTGQPMAVVPT
jgi:hypothetical protein